MAIVKCPECGGVVTDTVNQCVHCGCKYTVCKECGAIVKEGAQSCQNCGCQFTQTIVQPVAKTQPATDSSKIRTPQEVITMCKQDKYGGNIIGNESLEVILVLLNFALGLFLIIKSIVYGGSLSGYEPYMDMLKIVCIAIAVSSCIKYAWKQLQAACMPKIIWDWSKKREVDLSSVIENSLKANYDEMPAIYANHQSNSTITLAAAMAYGKKSALDSESVWKRIFIVALKWTSVIFLAMFVYDTLRNIAIAKLFLGEEYKFDFEYVEKWMHAVVWLLCCIASICATKIIGNTELKAARELVREEFPVAYETYKQTTKDAFYLKDINRL